MSQSKPKRSGKFWRRNEAQVMKSLGFKPTKNSGSGWVEKEDGQNDYLIAQLKSTDAQSIRFQQKDFTILEYNAAVAHKIPVFVIQFLNNDDIFVLVRPQDIGEVAKYINTGTCQRPQAEFGNVGHMETFPQDETPLQVKSDPLARSKFYEERNDAWKRQLKQK